MYDSVCYSLLNKGKKHSLVLCLSGFNSGNCILFQRVVFKKKTIENYKKKFSVAHGAVRCDITFMKDTQFFEELRKILRANLESAWMGSARLSLPVTLPLLCCPTPGTLDDVDVSFEIEVERSLKAFLSSSEETGSKRMNDDSISLRRITCKPSR
jgi:hypothetical protein